MDADSDPEDGSSDCHADDADRNGPDLDARALDRDDLEDHDGGQSEVLVIRVWRIRRAPGELRARLLRLGDGTQWTPTTLATTTDPRDVVRIVDAWLNEFLQG